MTEHEKRIREALEADRLYPWLVNVNPDDLRALLADLDAVRAIEDEVRHLLWGAHPECCGRPCVGAEYMGQSEMVCCGEFDSDTLSDAQIVVSLRARFPQEIDALKGASHE